MRPAFRRSFHEIGKLAELLFYPSFCRICSALLESPGERVVCRRCLSGMTPVRSGFCIVCGRFFPGMRNPGICGGCQNSPPPLARHRSCAPYQGTVKDVILLFKFRGYPVLGDPLARFAQRALGGEEDLWWGVEALVPVPLHRSRLKERGFNQSAVLARRLGKIRGLTVLKGALEREGAALPQTSLDAAGRRANVRGVFRVPDAGKVEGKRLLLVDDVFTTGATLEACARELGRAGAAEVRALTVAQA